MKPEQIRFTWSDAWLLAAIVCASREDGSSLKGIIAHGDLLNHAIFTPQEIRQGLASSLPRGTSLRTMGPTDCAVKRRILLIQSQGNPGSGRLWMTHPGS
jgi:hypothetical protein